MDFYYDAKLLGTCHYVHLLPFSRFGSKDAKENRDVEAVLDNAPIGTDVY